MLVLMALALGHTVPEYDITSKKGAQVFAKTQFSMLTKDVLNTMTQVPARKSVLLCGIEVCCA